MVKHFRKVKKGKKVPEENSSGGVKNLYVIVAMLSIIAALQSITDSSIESLNRELTIQIAAVRERADFIEKKHEDSIVQNKDDNRTWLRRLRDLLDKHITDPKIHYAGMAKTEARLDVLEAEIERISDEQRRRTSRVYSNKEK